MVSARLGYLDSDGERGALRNLCTNGRLALVFLRHTGCVFCREQVAELADARDLNVAFVSMSPPSDLVELKTSTGSTHRFLSDPGRELFDAFGMERAHVGQLISPKVVRRGLAALRAGHRNYRPTADPRALGGVVVLDRDAAVVWSRIAADAADNVSVKELRHHLAESQT